MQRSERLGLGVSAAAHVLLFGALSLGLFATRPLILNSPPVEVDLVDEVALKSATPVVAKEPPPPATAPETGPPEEAPPAPAPLPKVEQPPIAKPIPKPIERTPPAPPPPKPAPAPKPIEKVKPVEKVKPKPPAADKPKPKPAPERPAPAAITAKPAAKPGTRPRALALGDDIVKGAASERTPKPAAKPTPVAATPAATASPVQQRALNDEIRRRIKPNWVGRAPTGADAEQLVTVVTFQLGPDGDLVGDVKAVTTGITDSNRAQASVHKEAAIKAIRLSAPFSLPPELYDYWKAVEIRFDKRLSQ